MPKQKQKTKRGYKDEEVVEGEDGQTYYKDFEDWLENAPLVEPKLAEEQGGKTPFNWVKRELEKQENKPIKSEPESEPIQDLDVAYKQGEEETFIKQSHAEKYTNRYEGESSDMTFVGRVNNTMLYYCDGSRNRREGFYQYILSFHGKLSKIDRIIRLENHDVETLLAFCLWYYKKDLLELKEPQVWIKKRILEKYRKIADKLEGKYNEN